MLRLLLVVTAIVSYFCFDVTVSNYFHQWQHPHWVSVARAISHLGIAGYAIATLAALLLINGLTWQHREAQQFLIIALVSVVASGLICDVFKILLGRARPNEGFQHARFGFQWLQTHASFWSFPSGHSTTIAALMTCVALHFKRSWPLCLLTAIAVAVSRLVLTAHYPSDVIIGLLLGNAVAIVIYQRQGFIEHWQKAWPNQWLAQY